MSLEINVSIETNEDGTFGCATIPSLDMVVEWEYDETDNRVVLWGMMMDGRGISYHPEDPLIEKIWGKITVEVAVFLGRADMAAEEAKDQAVDMAIDREIEKRHSNVRE